MGVGYPTRSSPVTSTLKQMTADELENWMQRIKVAEIAYTYKHGDTMIALYVISRRYRPCAFPL